MCPSHLADTGGAPAPGTTGLSSTSGSYVPFADSRPKVLDLKTAGAIDHPDLPPTPPDDPTSPWPLSAHQWEFRRAFLAKVGSEHLHHTPSADLPLEPCTHCLTTWWKLNHPEVESGTELAVTAATAELLEKKAEPLPVDMHPDALDKAKTISARVSAIMFSRFT